ncbi:hypothetical protein MNBD_GAMMA01-1039 [hydrothermal vent metagenome]|uniref:RelE/StbE replicon stabilization toxin n=1 Tax=hydrothermal vent metagenome TaxID=652676 RepID=A0A3B0WD91_9ZZZZ
MTLALNFSCQAIKFIVKLPPKQYKQVVSTVFTLLKNPKPHDSKLLKGSKENNLRVDIGEYRIVYREENGEILIIVIGKRNDDHVYKITGRKK